MTFERYCSKWCKRLPRYKKLGVSLKICSFLKMVPSAFGDPRVGDEVSVVGRRIFTVSNEDALNQFSSQLSAFDT